MRLPGERSLRKWVAAIVRRFGFSEFSHRVGRTAAPERVFTEWAFDGRDMGMERAHAPVAMRILDQLPMSEDSWFLDIGCGNGYAVRWAARATPRGRAVGIDCSLAMIHGAARLSKDTRRADFIQCSFPDHPLPLGSFDTVFSFEALYYVDDLLESLREARRLLKPGGTLVSAVDYFRENRASLGWPGYVGAPMKLLSGRRWRRAFEQAQFDAVSQELLRIPASEAVEEWHSDLGSLVTKGVRPA